MTRDQIELDSSICKMVRLLLSENRETDREKAEQLAKRIFFPRRVEFLELEEFKERVKKAAARRSAEYIKNNKTREYINDVHRYVDTDKTWDRIEEVVIQKREQIKELEKRVATIVKNVKLDDYLSKTIYERAPRWTDSPDNVWDNKSEVFKVIVKQYRYKINNNDFENIRIPFMNEIYRSIFQFSHHTTRAICGLHQTWLAPIIVYHRYNIGDDCDQQIINLSNLMEEVLEIVITDNIVYLIPRPEILKVNERFQLHSTGGPAFASGNIKLFYLNGRRVMKNIALGNLTPEKILRLKNVEQRAEAIRSYGYEAFIQAIPHEVLDIVDDYVLIKVSLGVPRKVRGREISFDDCLFLKMKDPHSGTIYMEGIANIIHPRTVEKALEWQYGVEGKPIWEM